MEPPNELFTRGGPNAVDTRGPSMVAKHLEKLAKEKEYASMEKLQVLLPQLSNAVRAVALQECGWDAERALALLRQFQVARAAELTTLQAERNLFQAAKEKEAADGSGSGGGDSSSSGGASSSGGDSSSSDDGRARRRDGSKRKRSSKDDKRSRRGREDKKKKRSRKDKGRDKEKDRSRRRKEKRAKEEKRGKERRRGKDDSKGGTVGGTAKVGEQYGRYGVIRETDAYAKRPEFALWALEVKNVDLEALPRFEEKEMFRTFVEDYNTATLPHKKFYDLEAHERREAAERAAGGDGAGGERLAFDDEAERRRELEVQRKREAAERLQAAYLELKTTDKAEEMRRQELLRAKMALAYRTGDAKEAARLAERLKPDDQKAPAEAARAPRDPAAGT